VKPVLVNAQFRWRNVSMRKSIADMPTRREFLTTGAVVLASSAFGAGPLGAQQIRLSKRAEALPPAAFLPEPITTPVLQSFAAAALDAARSAGAAYADVRVAEHVRISLGSEGAALVQGALIAPQFMYGVRVMIDGAWASAHGIKPTIDAIVTTARASVATARGYARVSGANRSQASAPVVTGSWETPMHLDPFTVSLGDQAALLSAFVESISRVRHASVGWPGFTWIRETRVFASSEGSMVTQTRRTFETELEIKGILPSPTTKSVTLPGLWPASGGYECVTRPELQDELTRTAEDAAWLRELPKGNLDVGRYPVVVDGSTLGTIFLRTMGRALELDRASGDEGSAGESYLSPPDAMQGSMVASPLLSVIATRDLPSITATKWDDDGVETKAFPLIRQGQLVGYCSSRQTAPVLRGSPGTRGSERSFSNGCAVAGYADDPVLVRLPHVTIEPSSARTTLEDLCKGITRGILIRNARYVSVDPKCATGFLDYTGAMLEVERGKIVRRLAGNALQFSTPRFWQQSLKALGDVTTTAPVARAASKGQPESRAWSSARAPAAFFNDVDVINTRVRL
jgi:TldD protein